LKLKLRPQAPFLVTFSGIDGSGKTQHARVLEECLRHYGLRTSYHWSRCATSGIIRLASSISQTLFWRKTNNKEVESTSSIQRRQRLNNPILRFFWTYLTAFDMIVLNFFKVTVPLLKGNIVICDRYIFDAAAEMESSLPSVDKFNRLAIRLMLNLAPKPDIGYFLDVPEDVSTQRRDTNTDTDYLQKQRNGYVEMVNRYYLGIKRTDRDFADNTDEILREVAKRYFKNYPNLLNGLFLSNPAQINRR
jgi:thymidylate kinase